MARNGKRELMISFDKASELYLSALATEGKSSRYIDWLKTRLRYFGDFITRTYGKDFVLLDLDVEDGRSYLRELMERGTRYEDHPMHKAQRGKLKTQYIHGLGRAVRSFSTWVHEEGIFGGEYHAPAETHAASQYLTRAYDRRRNPARARGQPGSNL